MSAPRAIHRRWRSRRAPGVAPVVLLALVGLAGSTHAQERAAAECRRRVSDLLAPFAQKARIALLAVDAATDDTWIERRADEPQKPASVLKLFVTAAALDRFGPEFEYETALYLRGEELLVIGGGDPGLGDERIA
ncbi:MAG: hypothetical protein D6744_15870, partial [Planctomycetota bacterium]